MPDSIKNGATVALNRKARYDYALSDEIEAGIVLTGTEVKSLRQGRANIGDSYVSERNGEMWLQNADIALYPSSRQNHEPRRSRKLLLHEKQIKKLLGQTKTKGVTVVPTALYFNARGVAKIKICVARGKKEFEKRDTIKKRDWERDKARIIRSKNSKTGG